MGQFDRPLTVTKKFGAETWIVEREFTFYSSKGHAIKVAEGFETDFASVPWGFRNFFPKDFDGTQAAVTHDWLYNQRGIHVLTRKECDGLFLEAMEVLNVGWFRRHAMHKAVRSAGWIYWNKK